MKDHTIVIYFDNKYFKIDTVADSFEKAVNNAKFRLSKFLTKFSRYNNQHVNRVSINKSGKVVKEYPCNNLIIVN